MDHPGKNTQRPRLGSDERVGGHLPLTKKAEAAVKKRVASFEEALVAVSRSFAQKRCVPIVEQAHVDGASRYLGADEMQTKTTKGAHSDQIASPATHPFNEQEMKDQVRDQIREFLHRMEPHAFEHVIERLLSEMGYRDTRVTKPSNDKGVDVVGTITVALTEVLEVVQVKRLRTNVQRPALDMFRGTFHRFGAVRGTIINTSGFSRGARKAAAEPGAAPITLIDGETLVELLIEYNIGVIKENLELWQFDAAAFS